MTADKTLTGASLTWDTINWNKIERQVRRLQMRIAKAVEQKRWGRVKALQRLLTCSFYSKLLAVKRVVSNKGGKTSGVDKVVWSTDRQKLKAAFSLKRNGYKTLPLRRVYIPKANGKLRPLSIPVLKCRAMQALHLLALEPISETLADPNSYGFRPKRSVADAIAGCFTYLSRKKSAQWILEGDIKSCFDRISHSWLFNHIPMDKIILEKWLKAGYIDKRLHRTVEGTPQGGLISPTLLLMTLKGLEDAIKKSCKETDKVHVIIYADDFVVTGATKEVLENKVKPAIKGFLSERGLSLSEEKTKVTHIDDGFDFLGFNLRKYDGKLLIKPAKAGIKRFLANTRELIKSNLHTKTEYLIRLLNHRITGWSNFYRNVCSKETFRHVDNEIYIALWRWMKRRHPNKGLRWIKRKYFLTTSNRDWIFFAPSLTSDGKFTMLKKAVKTRIIRHVKIKAHANPYSEKDLGYFQSLQAKREKLKQPLTPDKPLFKRKRKGRINLLQWS